ncbi:MAG: MiaB/RimO family radical SAM methylthiotransferase, partial [Nocardioides sp.]|nr:MiaB/RimO family radical SAM methylthiotransferase [Nocardioides sp.]
ARTEHVTALVEELNSQRAEDRIGETVDVLVEDISDGVVGRAAHQGPEVDGTTSLVDLSGDVAVGDMVTAEVVGTDGVDLIASRQR